VDVEQVVQYAMTLPGVEYAERNLYTCSTDTQLRIKDKVEELNLNRVVVASCTPRTHETLFQETIREAGLNFYLFEMANIRDQCSWVHMHEPEKATEKAKDLLRIAVAKVKLDSPLYKRKLKVNNSALVIGGGISGMTAAIELANQGYDTHIVERSGELGGNLRKVTSLASGINPMGVILELEDKINNNERITLYKNAALKEVTGSLGNFKSTISCNGQDNEISQGAIIVATGARPHKPDEYLYGQDERVLLNFEMEEYLSGGDLKENSIVFIQCVGSRNEERPYCSRICCEQAVKNAIRIKQLRPESDVYILYREVRTYGFLEKYYRQAREMGVIFIRYRDDLTPAVTQNGNGLQVTVNDQMLREDIQIKADMVVLSSAVVAEEGNKELAQMLKVPLTEDNFFLEAHKKLRSLDFASDGIFLCGMAHSPMLMEESIAQATGAAARAATILSKEFVELEPTISHLVEEKCDGCAYCVDPCPFKAITLYEYETEEGQVKKMVKIDEALCKGCGTCMATCPKDAVNVRHFELNKLRAEVMAALGIEE
jgi:heterodisulfide reductase subunit A